MTLVKNYVCDSKTPTNEEILEAIEIAKRDKCIVKLSWNFPYSGWYSLSIDSTTSFEEAISSLPKIYPV